MGLVIPLEVLTVTSFTLAFVLLIRLTSWNCKNRNDPRTILLRAFGAVIACFVCAILAKFWKDEEISSLLYFGCSCEQSYTKSLKPILTTVALFTGPLIDWLIDLSHSNFCDLVSSVEETVKDLCFWRNEVIAPITEEWCFRSCTLAVLKYRFSKLWSITIAPLFFSLAHFHHLIEHMIAGRTSRDVFFQCLFQAVYTYFFGVYVSSIYVSSQCLFTAIACHSFCNMMGFPHFQNIFDDQFTFRRRYVVDCWYCALKLANYKDDVATHCGSTQWSTSPLEKCAEVKIAAASCLGTSSKVSLLASHTIIQSITLLNLSTLAWLKSLQIEVPLLSTGSTPSCSQPCDKFSYVQEMHPGNYIFYDAQQFLLDSCRLNEIACTVATRIVGHYPSRNELLIDCGFSALTKQGEDRLSGGYVIFPNKLELKLTGMTQELGKITSLERINYSQYPIGKMLLMYPYHSCATAALYDHYCIHENDIVTNIWKPCRGW